MPKVCEFISHQKPRYSIQLLIRNSFVFLKRAPWLCTWAFKHRVHGCTFSSCYMKQPGFNACREPPPNITILFLRHANLATNHLKRWPPMHHCCPRKLCLAGWTPPLVVVWWVLWSIFNNIDTVLRNAFNVAFYQVGFSSIFLLVSKKALATFGTIDTNGLIRVNNWASFGFCWKECWRRSLVLNQTNLC